MANLMSSLLCAGRSGESEKHRQSVRYEDPQQMGDAEASRGEHHSSAVPLQPRLKKILLMSHLKTLSGRNHSPRLSRLRSLLH